MRFFTAILFALVSCALSLRDAPAAPEDAYRWTVSLFQSIEINGERRNVHLCSGVLILRTWVLTAASCFDRSAPNFVAVGQHDLGSPTRTGHITEIRNIWIMSGYEGTMNDLALVEIIAAPIEPIVVLDKTYNIEQPYTNVSIFGWAFMPNETPIPGSGVLRQLKGTVLAKEKCMEQRPPQLTYTGNHLCAGIVQPVVPNNSSLVCGGDIGAPLVYELNGRAVLMGILTKGRAGCGAGIYTGMFTRTSRYFRWLELVVKRSLPAIPSEATPPPQTWVPTPAPTARGIPAGGEPETPDGNEDLASNTTSKDDSNQDSPEISSMGVILGVSGMGVVTLAVVGKQLKDSITRNKRRGNQEDEGDDESGLTYVDSDLKPAAMVVLRRDRQISVEV